jgi:metallo-beta-lactamase family protein
MKISFHGAARTVTGSKHIITLTDGRRILLDCGLFQGMGSETDSLNQQFGFDPATIDVLLLSHAHIDHTGLIPKLIKEGFTGKIICTEATKELAEILLYDSAEIQTYETEIINKKREARGQEPWQPLYSTDDVTQALSQFETVGYGQWVKVLDGVEALYTSTGHLIGSAAISLRIREGRKRTTILFTRRRRALPLCVASVARGAAAGRLYHYGKHLRRQTARPYLQHHRNASAVDQPCLCQGRRAIDYTCL